MPSHDRTRDEWRVGESRGWNAWTAIGVFVAWLVLARIGPDIELAPGVRAWYPPAALVAAALTLWGAKALVPIMLAATASSILTPVPYEAVWRTLLVSFAIKTIYWAGTRALRRRGFDCSFRRPEDVASFAAVFAVTAIVAAVVAVANLLNFAITTPDGLLLIRSFWVGDAVAVFAIAPAMLVIARHVIRARAAGEVVLRARRPTQRAALQMASIPLSLAAAALLAPALGFFAYSLCFIPLAWIALEHGPRHAALANLAMVLGALMTVHAVESVAPRSLEVQAFSAMLALSGLIIGSVADERQRAFVLLAESERRYRTLVEVLPDPIVVHEQTRITYANQAAADTLGAGTPETLIGRLLGDLAAPSSKDLLRERMRALSEGERLGLVRQTARRLNDGATVEFEAMSIPFTFEGRDAVLTVARDVTARLRLEEELRHAQRMEAVGRLAGGVAHDFNNLLTVITSYSELILATAGGSASVAHDVREIHHAAERAAGLTRQLLSFSRRQVLQPAPLDISEAVRGTEGLLRRLISPEIAIVSRLDPAAGQVLADRGQLEQVIVNLAVNARDAMPDGGTLTVETGRLDATDPAAERCAVRSDHYLQIVVRDTGAGIDEITMRHIFDPFFTTKEVGRGTGLGLATVHGIVTQSGGAVLVDSVLGRGTTFRVILPALPLDLGAALPDPVPDSHRSAPADRCVLLVEDDVSVRASLCRTLTDAGYTVLEAGDGIEALHQLDSDAARVDVVLTDVAMPRMDGRQLLQRIRERWPALPVVMMSGFADPTLEFQTSGDTVLLKPFAAAALTSALRNAMH